MSIHNFPQAEIHQITKTFIVSGLHRGRAGTLYSSAKASWYTHFSPCSAIQTAYKRPISEAVAGNLSQNVEKGAVGHTLLLHLSNFLKGCLPLAIPSICKDSTVSLSFSGVLSPPFLCLSIPNKVAHTNSLNASYCCRHNWGGICLLLIASKCVYFFGTFMPLTTS